MKPGLEARVYGVPVGTLHRVSDQRIHFLADAAWVDSQQIPRLGIAWLRSPQPRIGKSELPVWFENLLPEKDSSLRRWLCRQHGIAEHDSLKLLSVLGHDLPGALEVFGQTDQELEGSQTAVLDSKPRFSLTGVQFKLSMARDGDRFTFPVNRRSGAWIVKIPGVSYPELPEVEEATMRWAALSGLPVADCEVVGSEQILGVDLVQLGRPSRVLAVRRFDRLGEERVHQEDFAQALEVRPVHKYGDSQGRLGVSYAALGKLVKDVCNPEELTDWLQRLAFVLASGNGDGHLKNWSFQWGKLSTRPRLSPCYDQVCTLAWPEFGWQLERGPELSLAIGKARRMLEVTSREVSRMCEKIGYPEGVSVFMDALELYRRTWKKVSCPERMSLALQTHWQRVPLLQDFGGLN